MSLAYTIREVVNSSYYRSRPVETLQFLYSKWEFSRRTITDPLVMLQLVGVDPEESLEGFERWAETLERVVSRAAPLKGQGGINMREGKFLFGIMRATRPDFVIETGVAAGVSSCFLIAALIENGSGMLYSVDLPTDGGSRFTCRDGSEYDWASRGVGWVIPDEMKMQIGRRHVLILDDVTAALPRLLKELPYVDVFFHDDLHLPDHMLWEYESVWPHLREDGILTSHDVNMGWVRFCRRHRFPGQRLVNLNRLCAVRKPSEEVRKGNSEVSLPR